MRALIAEDEFVLRRHLQEVISPYGNCDVVTNGKEAVEAFILAWEEDEPYDLILLDIQMPVMNGMEALKEIRHYEKEKGIAVYDGIKVIMTTGTDDFDAVREAFRQQCEAYMVKPVDKSKLMEKIQEIGLIK